MSWIRQSLYRRRWWWAAVASVLLLLVVARHRLMAEYHYYWIVADVDSGTTVGHMGDLENFGHDAAIPPLLRLLRSPDVFPRGFAARALGKYRGAQVVDALIPVARDDPNENTRIAAIGSLGAIADPRALPALKELTRQNGYATYALAHFGEAGKRALLQNVAAAPVDGRRAGALTELCGHYEPTAFLRDPEVREEVKRRLSDTSPEVRIAAAQCVVKMDGVSKTEWLRAMLQDAEPMVRVTVASELGKLGDRSGFDAASAILRDMSLPEVARGRAALALRDIDDPRVYRLLCDAMRSREPYGVFDAAKVVLEDLARKDPKHPTKDCPFYAPY